MKLTEFFEENDHAQRVCEYLIEGCVLEENSPEYKLAKSLAEEEICICGATAEQVKLYESAIVTKLPKLNCPICGDSLGIDDLEIEGGNGLCMNCFHRIQTAEP